MGKTTKTPRELAKERLTEPGMVIIDGIIVYDGEAEATGTKSKVGQMIPGYVASDD